MSNVFHEHSQNEHDQREEAFGCHLHFGQRIPRKRSSSARPVSDSSSGTRCRNRLRRVGLGVFTQDPAEDSGEHVPIGLFPKCVHACVGPQAPSPVPHTQRPEAEQWSLRRMSQGTHATSVGAIAQRGKPISRHSLPELHMPPSRPAGQCTRFATPPQMPSAVQVSAAALSHMSQSLPEFPQAVIEKLVTHVVPPTQQPRQFVSVPQ